MIDFDQTKAEIQDAVRELQDEVPELQDVDLYQNKADLITAVKDAFHMHHQNEAGSLPEDGVVENTSPSEEHDVPKKATPEESVEDEPARPYSRARDLSRFG